MGAKINGRQIQHLRFADDIVLITPDISQAERMLADFDKACGKIGLRLNLKKTMFMKNGMVSFAFIHVQRNEYLRILQLCPSRSENQHAQRLSSIAEQKEMGGMESIQEHRGCSEENKEHPKNDVINDESLELAEPTGLLLHATGKNGGFTGARSSYSTINGNTGDTDDFRSRCKDHT
uniref:Reverse transcriptase domain-containing protein n=1 Tax=Angiostrongylus cantonensis TaxID=6313 RepID=A0A0K0DPJ0_ANGCA